MTKNAILISSGFFAIFFVGLIYQRYYSSDPKVGFENRRNAKEISIGMTQAEGLARSASGIRNAPTDRWGRMS